MIVQNWNNYLELFPSDQLDIYFRPEYVSLYDNSIYSMRAFVYSEGLDVFILPFLLGRIEESEDFDFVTPYGYGGPICSTDGLGFIGRAWGEFYREMLEARVVAGFIRFHPFYPEQTNNLPDFISTFVDRQTVFVDLTPSLDEIWRKQIHSKHRNAIRKSEREGLIFSSNRNVSKSEIENFRVIYNQTMNRLNADSFYAFSDQYFEDLLTLPEGSLAICSVILDSKVICSSILLVSDRNAHYHLSGTADGYQNTGANGYLLYKAIELVKSWNCSRFHLGGGTNSSSDNSLFKFKSRFSLNRLNFYLGKCILNPKVYEDLCIRWQKQNSSAHVLKYQKYHLKYRY